MHFQKYRSNNNEIYFLLQPITFSFWNQNQYARPVFQLCKWPIKKFSKIPVAKCNCSKNNKFQGGLCPFTLAANLKHYNRFTKACQHCQEEHKSESKRISVFSSKRSLLGHCIVKSLSTLTSKKIQMKNWWRNNDYLMLSCEFTLSVRAFGVPLPESVRDLALSLKLNFCDSICI